MKHDNQENMELIEISFQSDELGKKSVTFKEAVKVINGASNTGKSFLIECIDYMLGKEEVDKIQESQPYNEIALKLKINKKPFTLFREFNSKTFKAYSGHIDSPKEAHFISYYKTGNPTKNVENINRFFLGELKVNNTRISKNLYGEKVNLTIRLLSRAIISNEERILSKSSPIESGDRTENTQNRNVFKFLTCGHDDKKIETITRENEFRSETRGRITTLEEIIKKLKEDQKYPNESNESLGERKLRLAKSIESIQSEKNESKKYIPEILNQKRQKSIELGNIRERLDTIAINRENFAHLAAIYKTDIERLESQEEAAFLLTIGHHGECSVCGNISESVCKSIDQVKNLQEASLAEISKIREKDNELEKTIKSLEEQRTHSKNKFDDTHKKLQEIESDYQTAIKEKNNNSEKIIQLKEEENFIDLEINLRRYLTELEMNLQESELSRTPKKHDSKSFLPPKDTIDSFCRTYKEILEEIQFPGDNEVLFDEKNYDLIINGNPRRLNGKGVRAILHSVFKVALLKHCRENNLFHPGIIILDSPLVTYRDPIKSKHGELSEDEERLAKSRISFRFLEYLNSITHLGQFIIIENIDIPEGLTKEIGVETFYGENGAENDRPGLF